MTRNIELRRRNQVQGIRQVDQAEVRLTKGQETGETIARKEIWCGGQRQVMGRKRKRGLEHEYREHIENGETRKIIETKMWGVIRKT